MCVDGCSPSGSWGRVGAAAAASAQGRRSHVASLGKEEAPDYGFCECRPLLHRCEGEEQEVKPSWVRDLWNRYLLGRAPVV